MRVLVIGAGGREHAMVRALLRSPSTDFVACAMGNDGIAVDAPCVDIFAHTDIVRYCQAEKIDLVVIGPEQPLVDGLADRLRDEGIAVFGPSAAGAQLEASKDFTKKLCDKYNIPTAKYATFVLLEPALDYVRKHGAPIVIKADGLAAGKGVTVATTINEAEKALRECFDGAFGEAGYRVVIEECMVGEELSFFALCDGTTATAFSSAQDHKRAYDNDKGPNTGGMGTYSPTPLTKNGMDERIMREIIHPTMEGLKKELIAYNGVLFAGLMMTKTGPKLIEYNCRFGDPETQSMLARFDGDFAKLLLSCAKGKIEPQHIKFREEAAVCVVMAAKGYPGPYEKNTVIQNLDNAAKTPGVAIFHAGTARAGEEWVSRGGRVLNIVATATSLRQARYKAYETIDMIDWPEGFCRRDIGSKALVS